MLVSLGLINQSAQGYLWHWENSEEPEGKPMDSVSNLLESIEGVGRDTVRGGYSRPVFSPAELDLRSWFEQEARRRGLDIETDRNGILWAWWDVDGADRNDGGTRDGALVTGSHLDSVPGGGAFDGPLGVAAALNVSLGDLLDLPEVIVVRDSLLGRAVEQLQSRVPMASGAAEAAL